MKSGCLICERIGQIQKGTNPYFVKELESGYVVIGDHQFFRGYTLFLSKKHCSELHELDYRDRKKFLEEMSLVAQTVHQTFKPDKLNYELLGNQHPHLHWHLIPRHSDDPSPNKPIWSIDKEIRSSDETKPSPTELLELKEILLKALL
jgi:diadenosine tetraphosphate (Ap4A) HIT family hydrolase